MRCLRRPPARGEQRAGSALRIGAGDSTAAQRWCSLQVAQLRQAACSDGSSASLHVQFKATPHSQLHRLSKRAKTVNRIYGGALSHGIVKER